MTNVRTLNKARKQKDDEFYTRESDVEKEVYYYRKSFKDKIVYCNCDNYKNSGFYSYFKNHFNELGLKGVIATNYGDDAFKASFNGNKETVIRLKGDGSYKSDECLSILKNECDIIATNPPFSLFRDYMPLIAESGKNYLILGNQNAAKYTVIFPYIMDGRMHLGTRKMGCNMWFYRPDGASYERLTDGRPSKHMGCIWYTNLPFDTGEIVFNKLHLTKTTEDIKPIKTFETFDAIDIDNLKDIPYDYEDVMGVPLTFLTYFNPYEYDIVGLLNGGTRGFPIDKGRALVNGKELYTRILIKKK